MRDISSKFGIPNLSQSPDTRQNSDGDISDFRPDSRTSHETSTSKKIDDDVMSTNCNVIVFFPIYGQFTAIWKLDSRGMVYETYIFINNNFLLYKNWKHN